MIGIGPFEIFVVLMVMLVIVGPERMPEIVRFLSRVLREVRAAAGEMRQQVEDLAGLDEIRDQAEDIRKTVRDQTEDIRKTVESADVREDLRLLEESSPETASADLAAPDTDPEAQEAVVQEKDTPRE